MSAQNLNNLARVLQKRNGGLLGELSGNFISSPQPKIALNADFNIFSFYPYSETIIDAELPFKQGDELAFLNGYFPVCYNADHHSAFWISTQQFSSDTPITTTGIKKGNIILPIARARIKFKYDRLYYSYINDSQITLQQGSFTEVNFVEALTTPFIIWQGRETDYDISGFESENSFRVGIFGFIPTTAGEMVLGVGSGYTAKTIQVTASVTNAINPLSIEIQQQDQLSNLYSESTWVPASYPYNNNVVLPYRNGGRVEVIVDGGGAGEDTNSLIAIAITFKE